MTRRYIAVTNDTNLYRLLDAFDDVGIYYTVYGHSVDVTIVEIKHGKMAKTYEDAVAEVEQ